MAGISPERTESVFDDFKGEYTAEQAAIEANRCLFCVDAPCIKACPTAIDIPQFIRKIATDNVEGSAGTIFRANVLGMSCARVCPVEVLCVGDCVYNRMGVPPIQIGKLQRFATDQAFEAGWEFFAAGPDTGKSIGLVGGGPASLACAHELRVLGHRATIYEKRAVLGGLNTWGVAPYKMRADRADAEIEWVLRIGGIELKTGVTIGKDLPWTELEQKHDAVFVGLGLGADRTLAVPGASLPGIHGAVDWIEKMKLGLVALAGVEHGVIVGGGNTALDCVRELRGLDVPSVVMLYRGSEADMSGYAHEWAAAKEEGARAFFQMQPTAYGGDDRVRSVYAVQLDEQRKPVPGSEVELPADIVLLAIGQARLGDLLSGLEGVRIEDGRVVIDEHGCTGRPGWFSGGDCANGGKEVVNAVAEGKRAARGIDRWLRGNGHA